MAGVSALTGNDQAMSTQTWGAAADLHFTQGPPAGYAPPGAMVAWLNERDTEPYSPPARYRCLQRPPASGSRPRHRAATLAGISFGLIHRAKSGAAAEDLRPALGTEGAGAEKIGSETTSPFGIDLLVSHSLTRRWAASCCHSGRFGALPDTFLLKPRPARPSNRLYYLAYSL